MILSCTPSAREACANALQGFVAPWGLSVSISVLLAASALVCSHQIRTFQSQHLNLF